MKFSSILIALCVIAFGEYLARVAMQGGAAQEPGLPFPVNGAPIEDHWPKFSPNVLAWVIRIGSWIMAVGTLVFDWLLVKLVQKFKRAKVKP